MSKNTDNTELYWRSGLPRGGNHSGPILKVQQSLDFVKQTSFVS